MIGDKEMALKIWKFLEDNSIIVNEKLTKIDNPAWERFPYKDQKRLCEKIKTFFKQALDLSKGIFESAIQGAAIGATMSIISSCVQRHQNKQKVIAYLHSVWTVSDVLGPKRYL